MKVTLVLGLSDLKRNALAAAGLSPKSHGMRRSSQQHKSQKNVLGRKAKHKGQRCEAQV